MADEAKVSKLKLTEVADGRGFRLEIDKPDCQHQSRIVGFLEKREGRWYFDGRIALFTCNTEDMELIVAEMKRLTELDKK